VRTRAAAVLIAILAGCAPRTAHLGDPRFEDVTIGDARFRIQYWPEDAAAEEQVAGALAVAVPRVARWGKLAVPITITLHPTHAALEQAVRREGYSWLRAWARYATIDVQSPRTWKLFGASDVEVAELVTHELTHCAMYQIAASEFTWPYKGIPLWFREGLASVTAQQGYRRGKVEDLWKFYDEAIPGGGDGFPGAYARAARGRLSVEGDPIADPEPLYQEQSQLVYGAAHHAFEFLLVRYGEERVRQVLALMGREDGIRFARAFQEAIGIGEAEFAADFRRYVVWQGWRIE
jgi:hypothetical protein